MRVYTGEESLRDSCTERDHVERWNEAGGGGIRPKEKERGPRLGFCAVFSTPVCSFLNLVLSVLHLSRYSWSEGRNVNVPRNLHYISEQP